jgi:uncharacterized membrane protein
MVLRLAVYFVEAGYFAEVNMIFLVRGHTKNACDRCFNLLKNEFHDRQVYHFQQMVNAERTRTS